MVVVRYADDLVVGFERREDAERFLSEFQKRLANFALELHPEKTRLMRLGGSRRSIGNSVGKASRKRSRFLGSRTTVRRHPRAISLPGVGLCPSGCVRRF